MNIINNLLVVIIALLSVAAGIAKVVHSPQEVEFLHSVGLNNLLISVFGVVQILGGALLSNVKVRLYGAVIVCVGFLISAILIFVSGNLAFGAVSLLPVVLTSVLIWQAAKIHIANHSTGR